jgi:hypothetical protein
MRNIPHAIDKRSSSELPGHLKGVKILDWLNECQLSSFQLVSWLHTVLLSSPYFTRLHKTFAHLNCNWIKICTPKGTNIWYLHVTLFRSVSTETDEMYGWILLWMTEPKHVYKMATAECNMWDTHTSPTGRCFVFHGLTPSSSSI